MSAPAPFIRFSIAKPKILTGESISGYVARLSPFTSHNGVEMTLRYQGKSKHRLAWMFPSGLEQLFQLYDPAVPSIEGLLVDHTLFPLFRPFLPPHVVLALRTHFITKSAVGIAPACGLSGGLTSRWALAVCKDCISEDTMQGFAYWRTAHFVPGLALCPFHVEPLYRHCETCTEGFRHSKRFWLPSMDCTCGRDLAPVRALGTDAERDVEAAISIMVRQILIGEALTSARGDTILAAISRRAKELGHGGPGGVLRIQTLLAQRVGTRTLATHRFAAGPNTVFRDSLSGIRLPRNPVHNLILIYALFGTLGALERFISGEEVPMSFHAGHNTEGNSVIRRRVRGGHHRPSNAKPVEEIHILKAAFRDELLQLKKDLPNLKRSELYRVGAHKVYRFLLRFDKEWFDQTLPIRPFVPTSLDRYRTARAELDHSIAAHIRARQESLMNAHVPVRITHRRLLQGHSMESKSKKYFDDFLMSKLALETYTEAVETWRIRQTKFLINQAHEVSHEAPFDRSLVHSHLPPREFAYINRRVRKWIKAKTST